MAKTRNFNLEDSVSEMAIVDTFTKLIFGEEKCFSELEAEIISALRIVDSQVALNSYRDMGSYLRALGVKEMIKLVSKVRALLATDISLQSATGVPGYPPSTAKSRLRYSR